MQVENTISIALQWLLIIRAMPGIVHLCGRDTFSNIHNSVEEIFLAMKYYPSIPSISSCVDTWTNTLIEGVGKKKFKKEKGFLWGKYVYFWFHSSQGFVHDSFSLVNILNVASISDLTFCRRSCKNLHTCIYSSEAPLEICLPGFYVIVITLGCATLCLTQPFLGLFPNARGLGKERQVKKKKNTPNPNTKTIQLKKNFNNTIPFSLGNFCSVSTAVLLSVE